MKGSMSEDDESIQVYNVRKCLMDIGHRGAMLKTNAF